MTRPLLFLDVDGPLNPYAAKASRRPDGYTTHRMRPAGFDQPWQKPLRVWLNPSHGSYLTALPYDLVWGTTWAAEANEWIAPHIGLPALPVVEWPEGAQRMPVNGVMWKTEHLVAYAAGRPFAWVDDDITDADREYVTAHHDAPALLHWVSPRDGLLDPDFHALHVWASKLAEGAR